MIDWGTVATVVTSAVIIGCILRWLYAEFGVSDERDNARNYQELWKQSRDEVYRLKEKYKPEEDDE